MFVINVNGQTLNENPIYDYQNAERSQRNVVADMDDGNIPIAEDMHGMGDDLYSDIGQQDMSTIANV